MFVFVTRRVAIGVLTLLAVTILTFTATQVLPGNAILAKLGRNATPQAVAALRSQLHLNSSAPSQYLHWLSGLVTGNLGNSLVTGYSVSSVIGDRVGNTFALVIVAAAIGFPLALTIGIVAAVRRDRRFDHITAVLLLGLAALPEFVMAMTLIMLFSVKVLHLLPAVSILTPSETVWRQLNLVLLPAITLALIITPYIARMIRASMIEVLESDYITAARLKGLTNRRIVLRHALVNSVAPTLQVSAITLAYLAGGVVVVETVFRYPGLGSALVTAVQDRDLPIIQDVTVVFASIYVLVNILADVGTVLVTPKLRSSVR